MANSWDVIQILETDIDPVDLERSEALGMLALHLGNSFDTFNTWARYRTAVLPKINQVILEGDRVLINPNDREFILYLSYLIHRSIYGKHGRGAAWPRRLPDPGECSFAGCSKHADQRDHVWPNSLGGPYELWNFQWLCGFHNRMKSNSPLFAFKPSEEFRLEFTNWMRRTGQI